MRVKQRNLAIIHIYMHPIIVFPWGASRSAQTTMEPQVRARGKPLSFQTFVHAFDLSRGLAFADASSARSRMPIWSKSSAVYASSTGAPSDPPPLSPACTTGSCPDTSCAFLLLPVCKAHTAPTTMVAAQEVAPDNKRAVLQIYDAAARLQTVGTHPQATVCSVGARRCRSAADIRSRRTLLSSEKSENLRLVLQVITIDWPDNLMLPSCRASWKAADHDMACHCNAGVPIACGRSQFTAMSSTSAPSVRRIPWCSTFYRISSTARPGAWRRSTLWPQPGSSRVAHPCTC